MFDTVDLVQALVSAGLLGLFVIGLGSIVLTVDFIVWLCSRPWRRRDK